MEITDSEYNPVKEYLEHNLEDREVHLLKEEIDKVVELANLMGDYEANRGIRESRIEHNDREKAFHDQWLKENKPDGFTCNGVGLLQALFIEDSLSVMKMKTVRKISRPERMVVATVIQWLGSNIGWCFLSDSLKRCGYKIVPIDKQS